MSGTALDLILQLAVLSKKEGETLMESFIPAILKLCGRPNKVVLNRAEMTLFAIYKEINSKKVVGCLNEYFKSTNKAIRITSAKCLELVINTVEIDEDILIALERGLQDAESQVREIMKKTFYVLENRNPEIAKQ